MLMARYPRGYASVPKWLGFHDDMFPADTQNGTDWAFLTKLKVSGQDKNWAVAPIGGEMEPFQAEKWMLQEYGVTLKNLLDGHFSWIGPYCPALIETQDNGFLSNSAELLRRMGYDFQILTYQHKRVVSQGEPLQLFLIGANHGVAPFYYPWSVELALIDASGKIVTTKTDLDIRRWRPGNSGPYSPLRRLTFPPVNIVWESVSLTPGVKSPVFNSRAKWTCMKQAGKYLVKSQSNDI